MDRDSSAGSDRTIPGEAFQEELAAFAGQLRELCLQQGHPSLRAIESRARSIEGMRPLPPGTVSEVFNGKRLPRLDLLMALVRTLLAHDEDGQPRDVPSRRAPELDAWRDRWRRLEKLRQASMTSVANPAPLTPPRPSPSPRGDAPHPARRPRPAIEHTTASPAEPSPPPSSASDGANGPDLPQHVDALYHLADLEAQAGNTEEARGIYLRVIKTGSPEQKSNALISLGWHEKTAGNLDEARGLFQQAIEIGLPWHTGKALICWGCLERDDAGNVEEARRLWERTIETGQPHLASNAWSNLGLLARDAGNLEEARRLFRQATEIDSLRDKATALNHWANMERDAGNLERARQLYHLILDVRQPSTEPGE